jgi:hypothetical protein
MSWRGLKRAATRTDKFSASRGDSVPAALGVVCFNLVAATHFFQGRLDETVREKTRRAVCVCWAARATAKLGNGEICREGISLLLGALETVREMGAYWTIAIYFDTTTIWGEHVCRAAAPVAE